MIAVREWNTRIGRDGCRRAHSGHDLEGDAGSSEIRSLFSTSPKQKRIAPLESYDRLSRTTPLDQQFIDFLLAHDVAPTSVFSTEDPFRLWLREAQEAWVCQVVVDDHVGPRQALLRLERQQARISRPGPHEVHYPR
jgi:hypothetical protein